jgi:hypothetical protein
MKGDFNGFLRTVCVEPLHSQNTWRRRQFMDTVAGDVPNCNGFSVVIVYSTHSVLQVAVFSRTWRAPARHIFTWLESFNEKDMLTRSLRASPSIHSCEIIFGETTAEKCANYFSLRRKVRKLF